MTSNGKHFYTDGHNFTTEINAVPLDMVDAIICGDAIEMMKTIPNNSVDCVLTSPPYNFDMDYSSYDDNSPWVDYFIWLNEVWDECIRILKFGGRLIIVVQPSFSNYVPTHHFICSSMIQKKMIWKGEIIWHKNNFTGSITAWGSWISPSSPYLQNMNEYIEVFCKGGLKHIGNANDADITGKEFMDYIKCDWNVAPEGQMNKKYKHPAMFPERLVTRLIKLFTFRHDIILDPFNGAGTTTACCLLNHRHFIGIDISQEYCDTALTRNIKIMEADYFLGQE